MNEGFRVDEFRRNPALEAALTELARAIGPGGDAVAHEAGAPRRPILLIVSTPRAGSTLLLQWLARSGAFAVPSNLLARFWRAPAVGALVERLLFDPALDFRGETTVTAPPVDYRSTLGKTTGPRGPSEAWYLWRHFLELGDPPVLGPARRLRVDAVGFRGHLAAWERAAGRPIAMKAMIAAWELPFVARLLPTALFLDLDRDPVATMSSLLSARERFSGDRQQWYSFRTPEPPPEGAPPEEEVAWQVKRTREAIDRGLSEIEPSRVLRTSYEALCADAGGAWTRLRAFLERHGEALPPVHPDEAPFTSGERAPDPGLARAWEACP